MPDVECYCIYEFVSDTSFIHCDAINKCIKNDADKNVLKYSPNSWKKEAEVIVFYGSVGKSKQQQEWSARILHVGKQKSDLIQAMKLLEEGEDGNMPFVIDQNVLNKSLGKRKPKVPVRSDSEEEIDDTECQQIRRQRKRTLALKVRNAKQEHGKKLLKLDSSSNATALLNQPTKCTKDRGVCQAFEAAASQYEKLYKEEREKNIRLMEQLSEMHASMDLLPILRNAVGTLSSYTSTHATIEPLRGLEPTTLVGHVDTMNRQPTAILTIPDTGTDAYATLKATPLVSDVDVDVNNVVTVADVATNGRGKGNERVLDPPLAASTPSKQAINSADVDLIHPVTVPPGVKKIDIGAGVAVPSATYELCMHRKFSIFAGNLLQAVFSSAEVLGKCCLKSSKNCTKRELCPRTVRVIEEHVCHKFKEDTKCSMQSVHAAIRSRINNVSRGGVKSSTNTVATAVAEATNAQSAMPSTAEATNAKSAMPSTSKTTTCLFNSIING